MRLLTIIALTALGMIVESRPQQSQLAKLYNVEEVYVGCYRDDKVPFRGEERALAYPIKGFFGDKIKCVQACIAHSFPYAALQNGYLCFCGENFTKYGRADEKFCNMKCRGNHIMTEHLGRTKHGEFWEDCGGRWYNSVYDAYGLMKKEHLAQEHKLDDSWLYAKKK